MAEVGPELEGSFGRALELASGLGSGVSVFGEPAVDPSRSLVRGDSEWAEEGSGVGVQQV